MQMDPGAGSPYGGPGYFSKLMHPGSHQGAYGPAGLNLQAMGGYGSTGPGGMHQGISPDAMDILGKMGYGSLGPYGPSGIMGPMHPGVPQHGFGGPYQMGPGGVGHYGAFPQNPGQYPSMPTMEPGGFGTGGWGGVGSGGQGFMHPMHWNQLMDHLARGQHAFSGFGGGGVGPGMGSLHPNIGMGPSNYRQGGGFDGAGGGMQQYSPGDLGLQSYPGSPHPQARPFQGWGGGPVNY